MPTAQTILLGVHTKRCEPVDIKAPLHAFIKNTYSAREANEANDDLDAIHQLRAELTAATSGSQAGLRDELAK